MSDWNPAAFNWRRVLPSPTFNLHPLFVLALGLGLGASLPVASWIGLILLGFLAFVVAVEYAWILGSSIGRERKRLVAYRESVGHRSDELERDIAAMALWEHRRSRAGLPEAWSKWEDALADEIADVQAEANAVIDAYKHTAGHRSTEG